MTQYKKIKFKSQNRVNVMRKEASVVLRDDVTCKSTYSEESMK